MKLNKNKRETECGVDRLEKVYRRLNGADNHHDLLQRLSRSEFIHLNTNKYKLIH